MLTPSGTAIGIRDDHALKCEQAWGGGGGGIGGMLPQEIASEAIFAPKVLLESPACSSVAGEVSCQK